MSKEDLTDYKNTRRYFSGQAIWYPKIDVPLLNQEEMDQFLKL